MTLAVVGTKSREQKPKMSARQGEERWVLKNGWFTATHKNRNTGAKCTNCC